MLLRLMNEIRHGATVDTHTLAARLETTPEMIRALLDHLQRTGYLRPYENCAAGCQGCAQESNCQTRLGEKPQLWVAD